MYTLSIIAATVWGAVGIKEIAGGNYTQAVAALCLTFAWAYIASFHRA